MASVKVSIRAQLFNQRIGCCCLQVILITWLLWQPIHCNRNRVNEGNRSTKSSKQQLNQNDFDPLPKPNVSTATGTQFIANPTNNSSNLDNFNLNYILSVLHEDERQAILRNIINHQKSDTTDSIQTQTFVVPNQKKDDSVLPNNDIELGLEDKRDINEANRLSLFSSSLNVIDVEPQDTQLAHSVLIIHKPKPNKTVISAVKPTIAPQLLLQQSQQSVIYSNTISNNQKPIASPIITTSSASASASTGTTESNAIPFRNNHRPINRRPFPGLKTKPNTGLKITTTPTTLSITTNTIRKTTPVMTTIYAKNTTDSHTLSTSTTFATTDRLSQLQDIPIIINSNHKKNSFPMFTRQKLTSTEYALVFTTPGSTASVGTDTDKTSFTEVPTVSTPTYTFKAPYVTTVNHQKRPPMKILTVNANKVKPPDDIYSEGITVLDPPFISGHPMKLPPNTTIIHKNLIVPMKEGRPKPVFPISTTTQYPVYPIVAGITNWHTSPTTPWAFPIVTTASPEQIYEASHITSTVADISDSTDNTVTAQSVSRPTIITGHPISSTHPSGHTSHLVTITPIKSTSATSHAPTNAYIVTHSAQTPRPSTSTTTGYVNAIWAPPMPIARPVQAIQSQPVSGGWFAPISNIFSVDPTSGSMFSFMSIMKTVLFTVLVFFLPPLTLAAALFQTAVG